MFLCTTPLTTTHPSKGTGGHSEFMSMRACVCVCVSVCLSACLSVCQCVSVYVCVLVC